MDRHVDGPESEHSASMKPDGPSTPPATGARHDGWVLRIGGVVGDLSSPFYDEERQRDVWNEASAVGLQVVLWLGLATATAMIWIGGSTAVPYALALAAVVGIGSLACVTYAQVLGVQADVPLRPALRRLIPYLVLLFAFFAGLVRAFGEGSVDVALGAVVGGLAGVAAAIVGMIRGRRRTKALDTAPRIG